MLIVSLQLILFGMLSLNPVCVVAQAKTQNPDGLTPVQWLAIVLGSGGVIGILGIISRLYLVRSSKKKNMAETRKLEAEADVHELRALQLKEQFLHKSYLAQRGGENLQLSGFGNKVAKISSLNTLISKLGYRCQVSSSYPSISFKAEVSDTVITIEISLTDSENFQVTSRVSQVKAGQMRKGFLLSLLEKQKEFENCQISLERNLGSYVILIRHWGRISALDIISERIVLALDQVKRLAETIIKALGNDGIPFAEC